MFHFQNYVVIILLLLTIYYPYFSKLLTSIKYRWPIFLILYIDSPQFEHWFTCHTSTLLHSFIKCQATMLQQNHQISHFNTKIELNFVLNVKYECMKLINCESINSV